MSCRANSAQQVDFILKNFILKPLTTSSHQIRDKKELNMSNVDSSIPAVANTPAAINGTTVAGNSPTVALFQKAHAKMITLQRVDEQLQTLIDQRKKLQEELRGIQTQINDEFERLLSEPAAEDARAKIPAAAPAPFNTDMKPTRRGKDAVRMEVAEAV
jgi:hypothetical protein